MLYVVEVAIEAGKLAHEFRQIPGTNVYRVDFEDEIEARTFAQAFAGQVPRALPAKCGTLVIIGVGEPCAPA